MANFFETILGGPKSSTTITTVESKPDSKSNTAMIVVGVLLFLGIVIGLVVWSSKKKKTAESK